MKRVTKTAFRDMPSVELGRDGVLEVVSHGTVVGYWVPRDEWKKVQEYIPPGIVDDQWGKFYPGAPEEASTPTSGRTATTGNG